MPFASAGEDLVLTPAHRVQDGQHLQISISHSNDPTGNSMTGGWIPNPGGLELLNEPDAAHRVIPSNDHPSDKAYFTYRITTPAGVTAVANGVLISHTRHGATTTSVYRGEHPMTTDLMQISLGDSKTLHRQGPHGLPMRDVDRHRTSRHSNPGWRRPLARSAGWRMSGATDGRGRRASAWGPAVASCIGGRLSTPGSMSRKAQTPVPTLL